MTLALAKTDALVQYTRELSQHWADAINTIAPKNDNISWLYPRWEPGDTWEPIHRWVIWQMRPPKLIRPDIKRELEGPHPRSAGHYCAPGECLCKVKTGRWRGGIGWDQKFSCWKAGAGRQTDLAQWQIYRETGGHFGKRWWVVQGNTGGHRFQLDKHEAKVSKIMGGPADTPAAGDLPYADIDLRVIHKIADLDRVRAWKHVLDFCDRNHDQMDAEEKAEGEKARWAMWHWLESQVKHTTDKMGRAGINALRDAAPRILGAKDTTNYEALQHDFIHGA